MSNLLPIPLIAKGTTEVESLSSYLARLAYHHSVSIGQLLKFILIDDLDLDIVKNPYVKPHSIIQPNITTNRLIYRLEEKTGFDCQESALTWMGDVLGRASGEFVTNYRWCPECFKHMYDIGVEPYIKLKWHLSAYNHCPLHLSSFLSECESCGNNQVTYTRKNPIYLCQKCSHPLFIRINKLISCDVHNSWDENGFDMEILFSNLVEYGTDDFINDGVVRSLESIFDFFWENGKEDVLYGLLGRDFIIEIIHKQKKIGFKVARRIAFRLGISLHSLFCGQALREPQHLNLDFVCELPRGINEYSYKMKRDHEYILKTVNAVIEESSLPVSLKQLANETGQSTGYLRYRYPELCRAVVEQHKKYLDKIRLKKVYQAQKLALQYFFDQKYSDYPKSKRQAYKEVKRETGLAKGVIEQAIKRAYNAMY